MRKQKGFSLIELLIVVAIILIIAAIAIPNLLRSRIAANEASAVGSLRTLNTAEVSYITTYPNSQYATTNLNILGDAGTPANCPGTPDNTHACLIDSALEAAVDSTHGKSGYYFTLASDANIGYTIKGTPVTAGTTGNRQFYTDSTAVIHYNLNAAADSASTVIQ